MATSKKIELVCPAGGWDQLIAAINAGADAVYLGYKKFGARAYAENFDLNLLKEAVGISHSNDVRVYLTLNTLIKDPEINELAHFLNEYLSFCSDGIIIQDLGLFKMIKDLFPASRIHASTQLNIHNLKSAILLQELGFSRVILARELTLEEIKNISSKAAIEIEVFGHGSQCYSYSGNCYFSSFTGLRSGNRGRCTQPCRMKYSLESVSGQTAKNAKNHQENQKSQILIKDSYILSKTDLSTLEIIPKLAGAGINALKIEGRMKTAEYVGIITKIYRKYLDLYYRDPANYEVDSEDIYKMSQIFSREMGTGYFLKRFPKEIVSLKKSGSVGNFLGRIERFERKAINIKSSLPVRKDDKIEIWTNRGNEQLTVEGVKLLERNDEKPLIRIETDKEPAISIGDRVFKLFDAKLEREARDLYIRGIIKNKSFEEKNIGAEKTNIESGKGHKKEHEFKQTGSTYKQLSKKEIEEYFGIGYGTPAAKPLNHKKLIKKAQPQIKPGLSVLVYSLDDAASVLNADVKNIIIDNLSEVLDLKKSIEVLKRLNKHCVNKNKNLVIKTPHIIYDDKFELLENATAELISSGINNFSVSNTGVLNSANLKSMNIFLDYSLNIFNSRTTGFFHSNIKKTPGSKLKNITLSAELDLEEVKGLIRQASYSNPDEADFSVYSYGYYPVMTSRFKLSYLDKDYFKKPGTVEMHEKEYCLVDRKGYKFRMMRDYSNNLVVLNSKKICNFFNLPDFYSSGINCFLIDSRIFKTSEIIKVIEFYNRAFDMIGGGQIQEFEKFSAQVLKNRLFSDYTKGHFFREVL